MKLTRNRLGVLLLLFAAALAMSGCRAEVPEQTQQTEPKVHVIMPRQDYQEPVPMDYSLSGLPEFVDDLSQCTDTGKQYVLPNGYLYQYGPVLVPNVTNQLPLATDENGEVFLGCGYQDNVRLRSVLQLEETNFSFVTGFIPVRPGDVIYFSGNVFDPQHESANNLHIAFYNFGHKSIGQASMTEAVGKFFDVVQTNEEGYVTALRIRLDTAPWDMYYIRFTLLGSGSGKVISINEPQDEVNEVNAWYPAERYVSGGWVQEIRDTVQTVNSIELEDPAEAISFVFAADIHVGPDPSSSYTDALGRVCAEVMHDCDIPFFVTGGDNCTQSAEFMPNVFGENMSVLLKQLEPIPQKNILLSLGNHDGATGFCEEEGELGYYRYQLSNEQRSSVFFDWQRESNENKRFDSDGTYYYMDDPDSKTRYIILNSFWSQWEGDEDGFVADIQHSFFHVPMFGPQQLTWFAEKALDMPAGYGAVIITHFAPDAQDFEIFKGIVDAFNSRSRYEGSYVGGADWQSTQITANYKYAEGEILAVFQGHNHEDAEHDYFQTVPCINVTSAGAHWALRGETALERVKGTALEFAVDVVVIDREERTIYLTRLGSGEDRTIRY